MKKAYIFLAEGFEEIEAITTIDILKRGGIDIQMISITDNKIVKGAHEIPVECDNLFNESDLSNGSILILPGGMPGTRNLQKYKPLEELINKYHEDGKYIAAICAAPVILGGLGILKGKNATSYPGFEEELTGANLSKEKVVKDGKIITSRGPATAIPFALKVLETLSDEDNSSTVSSGLLFE